MVEIELYKFREKTNLQEHNDIVNKLNEVVEVINDADMDAINTRLTNDESQIAVNTAGIKTNKTDIDALKSDVSAMDSIVDRIEPMVDNHETDIANLKEAERRLSNDMPAIYTLYRNGEGKIKVQVETVGGTLINSNTLDMIIPYQYDIISGTTNRSFKLAITMSDGSSYTTNDFVIPEGGGTDITVTGITLSKDSSNVNRFHVGINLSDGTMIDSGYITMIDNVSATFADSKLTISVNGVSSVPVVIDTGSSYVAGTGIIIDSGTIAIDSTVVALKSDISDMETKSNAEATYATKTALALTDSVANDANEKANNCIDNVSISDNVLTFTKTDDTHIDITLPSRTINTIDTLIQTTITPIYSSTTYSMLQYGTNRYAKTLYYKYNDILLTCYPADQVELTTGTFKLCTNSKAILTEYINKLHSLVKFDDGKYTVRVATANDATSSSSSSYFPPYIKFTVSDGELTSITTSSIYGERTNPFEIALCFQTPSPILYS